MSWDKLWTSSPYIWSLYNHCFALLATLPYEAFDQAGHCAHSTMKSRSIYEVVSNKTDFKKKETGHVENFADSVDIAERVTVKPTWLHGNSTSSYGRTSRKSSALFSGHCILCLWSLVGDTTLVYLVLRLHSQTSFTPRSRQYLYSSVAHIRIDA